MIHGLENMIRRIEPRPLSMGEKSHLSADYNISIPRIAIITISASYPC